MKQKDHSRTEKHTFCAMFHRSFLPGLPSGNRLLDVLQNPKRWHGVSLE